MYYDNVVFDKDEQLIVDKYMERTDAFVAYDESNDRYLIVVPEDTYYYDTKEDLMYDIIYTLLEIEKLED